MDCSKTFTINVTGDSPPPAECLGNPVHIDDAVWTGGINPGSTGGGTVSFAGSSGTVALTAASPEGQSWSFATIVCNPTDDEIIVAIDIVGLTYEATYFPGEEIPGGYGISFLVNAAPAGASFSMAPHSLNIINADVFLNTNVTISSSSLDATVVFTQPP